MKIFFAVTLLLTLYARGECSGHTKTCKDTFCIPEALCWYDHDNPPKCEDRCGQPNPCKPGYYCVTERGWCGNETCKPEAVCYPNPPEEKKTCKDIFCIPEALCWYDHDHPPKCEDRCQPNPCKPGHSCITEKGWCGNETCRPEAMCYPSPPVEKRTCKDVFCYPEALCWHDEKHPPKCEDLCQPNPCEPGYNCITERGECGTDTCRPRAKCYLNNDGSTNTSTGTTSTCKDVLCYPEALCWYDQYNPPKCENKCRPNYCDAGFFCVTERGWCGDDTCKPIFACYPNDPDKPVNPCEGKVCYPEALCWYDKYHPARCDDLCEQNPCQPGHYCVTERGWCGNEHCPPQAVCYPNEVNPCDGHECPQNSACWYDRDHHPQCADPCRTIKCPGGYICRPQAGKCGDSSCPPKGRCHNPCELLHCPENNFCYFDGKHGKCVNPCASNPCPYGFQCSTHVGSCGNFSCSPVAHCNNPCDTVRCGENSLCYSDGKTATCVNPCAPGGKTCPADHRCVTQVGSCGTNACPPLAHCEPYIRPPNSCHGVKCPGNKQCRLIDTLEFPQVPVCDENPCIRPQQPCCRVRDANGTCNNDGCYVKFKKNSCVKPNGPCQVKKVCLDPCRVENRRCPLGTSCYKNEVECFTEPCNPVTTCRTACDSQNGTAPVCYNDQECDKIYVNCAPSEAYNYDPFTCKTMEFCKSKN